VTRSVTVLPSAYRLMESLRDIGYDLPSAVADLVDNSIDAGARNVEVTLEAAGPASWIRIADDGLGMTARQIDEAMRYGTSRGYEDSDLGHFGLGLKTGSLSQCRCLTVASRRTPEGRLEVRRWDLDAVAQTDSWDLERPRARDIPEHLKDPLRRTRGTVVFWEKLDRVLAFRNPSGSHAKRALESMISEVSDHLGMVFHRFITGEWAGGEVTVNLTVNGKTVEPWDPFARSEPKTRALAQQKIDLPLPSGGIAEMVVEPFVLPAQTQFSSGAAHVRAAGPKRWNRQQGFYIYRRERLIQSGGWNRLRTVDEHAKLARIAVDLPIGREDLFNINVAKRSLSIPDAARAPLRAIASAVVNEAQRSYRDHLPGPAPSADVPDDVAVLAGRPTDDEAPSISGDWPLILRTLDRTLGDDPQRRDMVLHELVNAFD
jgi:hypothetical protein